MAFIPNMVLYYKPSCPYCVKVLAFMEQNGIALEMRSTLEPGVADELVAINGTTQVPCLVVDGQPMLESDDIIAYLQGVVDGSELG